MGSFEDAAEAADGAGFVVQNVAVVIGIAELAAFLEFLIVSTVFDGPFPDVAEDAVKTELVGGGVRDGRRCLGRGFECALRKIFEFLTGPKFLPLF